MFETLLKIFLYFLIIGSLFLFILHALVWLIRRQPLLKPKQIWSDIIQMLSGVLGLWLLNSATLESRGVLLVVGILTIGSFFALSGKEFIASFRR